MGYFITFLLFLLSLGMAVVLLRRHRVDTRYSVVIFLAFAALVYLSYRVLNRGEQRKAASRAAIAQSVTGSVHVAAVWPANERPTFLRGVRMAEARIRASGGLAISNSATHAVVRRPLVLEHVAETGARDGSSVALKVAAAPRFVAVIGHAWSDTAIPASIVYERNKMLFLSPAATNPRLVEHHFDNLISLVPSDRYFGARIAKALAEAGHKRVVLLYDINYYGVGLADCFEDFAGKEGVAIVLRQSYNHAKSDFRPLLAEIAPLDFDALVLADSCPEAARMIRQIREMGIARPVYGGDGLDDSRELARIAGRASDNTVVATVFAPELLVSNATPAGVAFAGAYRAQFQEDPDYWAVQGYESVTILAQAYERAGTIASLDVASTLKYSAEPWEGVLRSYRFSGNGEIQGKTLIVKRMTNGRFAWWQPVKGEGPP